MHYTSPAAGDCAGGCGKKEQQITTLKMLEGRKTFVVPIGTETDQIVLKRLPDAKFEYYNSVIECSLAVAEEKADAVAYDKPILKNIATKSQTATN
jgi:polar amino acid transport system substrate-binding protein